MDDLYTVRQVQDFLKVDRITVYRMLQDGRLKGIKIGQQWRFPIKEVEKLISRFPGSGDETESIMVSSEGIIPTHCVQTIQNLFTDISNTASLVVDMNGNPLTQISSACQFCQLMTTSLSGQKACQESWKQMAESSGRGESEFDCHAGLHYHASPLYDQGNQIGAFLSGQVYLNENDPETEFDRITSLARAHNIEVSHLLNASRSIMVMSSEENKNASRWPISAAKAIHSILNERSGFIQRLQKIADLTQIA